MAIKVVDHLAHNEGADKAAAEEQRVAREALLSASLSHPNVIATYKICTVRAGDSNASSREAVEAGHRPAKPFPPPEDAECAMLPARLCQDYTHSLLLAWCAVFCGPGSAWWRVLKSVCACGRRGRMSALLETWLVQEYADKGSLADAIAAGRFRRKLDGSVDVVAILKCLNDVAAGACAPHHLPTPNLKTSLAGSCVCSSQRCTIALLYVHVGLTASICHVATNQASHRGYLLQAWRICTLLTLYMGAGLRYLYHMTSRFSVRLPVQGACICSALQQAAGHVPCKLARLWLTYQLVNTQGPEEQQCAAAVTDHGQPRLHLQGIFVHLFGTYGIFYGRDSPLMGEIAHQPE